jgi:hypothetical protein
VFSGNKLASVTLGANVGWQEDNQGKNTWPFKDFAYYSYLCNGRKAGTYRIDANWSLSKNNREAEGFTFAETPYGLAITGYTGDSKRLSIPAALEGKPVKYIERLHMKGLTGLRIPNGVAAIGRAAFSGNGLASVTIPGSVTYIGRNAFSAAQLTSVTIPANVTYIGNSAFSSNELASVTIPGSVTYIEDNAFANNKLKSVTIGDGVTTIGYEAFANNELRSVTIPGSVTYIGKRAFAINQLTSVTLPANVTLGKEMGLFSEDAFDHGLHEIYTYDNGRKAGTYTSNDRGGWTYTGR